MSAAKTIQVKVKPGARVSSLELPTTGDTWLARLKSPPVDGKANRELIALIAEHFGCSKSVISIKAGASGRIKLIQIEAATAENTVRRGTNSMATNNPRR